jgi:SAM-dependent methyltransferase
MELNQYKYMFEVEDRHWWYVGNHERFIKLLQRKYILKDFISMLDAGCGTGKWLERLKNTADIYEMGIDNNETALDFAAQRGKLNLQPGDVNRRMFTDTSFDLITSFDVICNINVEDTTAIKNFHAYLKDDGYLLLSVPAYQFLHSRHDEVVHQNKRYTRRQVKWLLKNNGFEIVKISYGVCLLFPLALVKRITGKLIASHDNDHNEVEMPSGFINKLFLAVMRFENFLLRYICLPFGLSVFVLARKRRGR